jgi:hypothetical protein
MKRRRSVVVLLLPATIFLWIIGWTLYVVGGRKPSPKTVARTQKLSVIAGKMEVER